MRKTAVGALLSGSKSSLGFRKEGPGPERQKSSSPALLASSLRHLKGNWEQARSHTLSPCRRPLAPAPGCSHAWLKRCGVMAWSLLRFSCFGLKGLWAESGDEAGRRINGCPVIGTHLMLCPKANSYLREWGFGT